jgi:hypothetical protein
MLRLGYRILLARRPMTRDGQPPPHVTWSIEMVGDECLLVATREDGLRIAQLHDTREEAEAHARQLYAYLSAETLPCPEDAESC